MSLAEAMETLEAAGSAQTRKTYTRHGAREPMFGVSFATLKAMVKRIGVDQELAVALWETGNYDARNLAMKVADPQQMTEALLDRWAREQNANMGGAWSYLAYLCVEGPHAPGRAESWLAAQDDVLVVTGWCVVGAMAMVDEETPGAWFQARLAEIEAAIRTAPNARRLAMLNTMIAIGCRSGPLRELASAAAVRIGPVEIDHGDTACKTPEVVPTLEKTWAWAASKGFPSPAAQERTRESMRTRC
jgi:hypothetical protein